MWLKQGAAVSTSLVALEWSSALLPSFLFVVWTLLEVFVQADKPMHLQVTALHSYRYIAIYTRLRHIFDEDTLSM